LNSTDLDRISQQLPVPPVAVPAAVPPVAVLPADDPLSEPELVPYPKRRHKYFGVALELEPPPFTEDCMICWHTIDGEIINPIRREIMRQLGYPVVDIVDQQLLHL
jgi:hypothetical protein